METSDPKLIIQWIEKWSDIVDFEVIPVMSSADAARAIRAKL